MTDIVDTETRRRMMAGIRGKNTGPELLVRRYLHAQGFRFRLHDKKLPGKPDIVLKKWKAVIFVHGCFWHWHDCRYFKLPKTRTSFWQEKLAGNKDRDVKNREKLEIIGWRVIVVHECALRDNPEEALSRLKQSIYDKSVITCR